MLLKIDQITVDQKLNPRVDGLDIIKVSEYAERMSLGDKFPAIDVFSDGNSYWVVDGFHRIEASKHVLPEISEIEATIYQGSWRDAKLFTFGANAEHGIRRTNMDKRRVVTEMLEDEEWRMKGDSEIARICKVTQPFVWKLRQKLSYNGYKIDSKREVTRGEKTYTMQTANIGGKVDSELTGQIEYPVQEEVIVIPPSPTVEPIPPTSVEGEADDELDEIEAEPVEPTKEKSKRVTIPPRSEEQKEQDRKQTKMVIGRHERLAVILRIMENVPAEVISFVYRDLARQYHPDKQNGVDPKIATLRTEAFAFIAEVRQIWEVHDADFRTLARVKGIIEKESS